MRKFHCSIIIGLLALFLVAPLSAEAASPWSRESDKRRAAKVKPEDKRPFPLSGKFLLGGSGGVILPYTNSKTTGFEYSVGFSYGLSGSYYISNRIGVEGIYRHIFASEKNSDYKASGDLLMGSAKIILTPLKKRAMFLSLGLGSASGEVNNGPVFVGELESHTIFKIALGALIQTDTPRWTELSIGYTEALGDENTASLWHSRENLGAIAIDFSFGIGL